MWIMTWELIIFSILLALILWYFWGFWLSVNKDTYIDAVVHAKIRKLDNEEKERENINEEFNYKIGRVILYDKKTYQYYKQYKIILTDKEKKPLTEKAFEKIVQDLFLTGQKSDTSSRSCDIYKDFWKFIHFNKSFWFDKKKDVDWNGGVDTIARYHNVWMYNWKKLDLLVKVIKLKNMDRLYNSSNVPKWFKATTLNWKWAIWFFLDGNKNSPVGTRYSVTLQFTFVKAWTSVPVRANFNVLINDIDNTPNRKEMIIVPHDSYSFYKVSSGSFVYGIGSGSLDYFFDVFKNVKKNYPFDIKGGKMRFWDFRSEDQNGMVKFFYKNKSSFIITFSVTKKKWIGYSFWKAWFLLSFGSNFLTGCNNFYKVSSNNNLYWLLDRKLFNNMLIFEWDVTKLSDPINYFWKYKLVVLSWLVINESNFNRAYQIINSLSGFTNFIGLIKFDPNITNYYRNILYNINLWRDLGIKWILLKGFDKNKWLEVGYWSWSYDKFIKSIINYSRLLWLKVIGDVYLVNDDFVNLLDGIFVNYSSNHLFEKIHNLKNKEILCYSFVWNPISKLMHKFIFANMDRYCSYRTIQADLSNSIVYGN